jgi:LysM repeat protein
MIEIRQTIIKYVGIITIGFLSIHASNLRSQALFWHNFEYQKYPWIDSNMNIFQSHDKQILRPFFNKLNGSNKKRVNILHIGDSHVQADIFTNETRTLLGSTFGNAGRGMVFPYTTARTHTAADYRCFHTGRWLYARNVERSPELPIGVTGITSKTYDSTAQFKLSFREKAIQPEFTRLKIFCHRSSNSFDLKITAGGKTVIADVYTSENDTTTDLLIVNMPTGADDYLFEFVRRDSAQHYFEIYGISIESPSDRGVLYTSVGINGAGHYSIMRENKLPDHLKILNPDAIILDVGANDFYQKGIEQERFKDNLISIIEMFKEYAPGAVIILSNSQDIHRGGYSIKACSIFSYLIAEVAKSEKVAFYDWYRVAGGQQSMRIWKSVRLANKDGVHLNRDGYELKGSLIYHAFKNTDRRLKLKKDTSDAIIIPCVDTLYVDPVQPDTSLKQKELQWIEHTVKKGETAWAIAQRYNISVIQLKDWNRLKGYALNEGQTLRIFTVVEKSLDKGQSTVTNKPTYNPGNSGNSGKPGYKKPKTVYYKVRSGDTLYGIARRHGLSVAELKRMNGMRSDFIKPGKTLKVK